MVGFAFMDNTDLCIAGPHVMANNVAQQMQASVTPSIELQVGTYGCSVYGVPYNFFQKAYKGMLQP